MNFNEISIGHAQSQLLSLANLIQWGDHFSVNHQEIDAQHKEIFDLGISVYEKWRNGEGVESLLSAMEKLTYLVKAHFLYEERLLSEIKYEDINEHIAEHRRMRKDLNATLEEMNERLLQYKDGRKPSGGSLLRADWPMMQFVLGFAVGHVGTSDMRYCKALAASNMGNSLVLSETSSPILE